MKNITNYLSLRECKKRWTVFRIRIQMNLLKATKKKVTKKNLWKIEKMRRKSLTLNTISLSNSLVTRNFSLSLCFSDSSTIYTSLFSKWKNRLNDFWFQQDICSSWHLGKLKNQSNLRKIFFQINFIKWFDNWDTTLEQFWPHFYFQSDTSKRGPLKGTKDVWLASGQH